MSDMDTMVLGARTYKMKASETTLGEHAVAVMDTGTEAQCKRPTGDGETADIPVGVLMDSEHAAGNLAAYQNAGFARVTASAAIDIGDRVVISAVTGTVRTFDITSDSSGIWFVGVAQESADSSGDVILIWLTIGSGHYS